MSLREPATRGHWKRSNLGRDNNVSTSRHTFHDFINMKNEEVKLDIESKTYKRSLD